MSHKITVIKYFHAISRKTKVYKVTNLKETLFHFIVDLRIEVDLSGFCTVTIFKLNCWIILQCLFYNVVCILNAKNSIIIYLGKQFWFRNFLKGFKLNIFM